MKLTMQRFRDDMKCDPAIKNITASEFIKTFLITELEFGGKVIDTKNNLIEIHAKVFGCLDKTFIEGNADEIGFITNVINTFKESKTAGVNDFILNLIRVEYDPNVDYVFNDVMDLYELSLEGPLDEGMVHALRSRPKVNKTPKIKTVEDVEKFKDQMDKLPLDKDDGAYTLTASNFLNG